MQAVIIHDVFEHFIHVSLLFDHESQLEGDDAPVGRPLEAALHYHPLSVVLQAVADLRPRGVPVRRLDGDEVFLEEEIGMKFVAAVPGSQASQLLQGSAKRWSPGCMNAAGKARQKR